MLLGAGTTFLETPPKVDASQINAFYFFDVWFSPTASLVHAYSKSVLVAGCIRSPDKTIEAETKSVTPFDMSSLRRADLNLHSELLLLLQA